MTNRKAPLAILAAVLCLGAAIPASASAAVSVPNGAYGPVDAAPDDPFMLGFKTRSRTLYDIRAAVLMSCHNTDTGETYDRAFIARRLGFSRGARVPNNGTVRIRWRASDSLRSATVTVQATFRNGRTTLASVDVASAASGGSLEECDGGSSFRMARAPLR